jgi:transposase
MDSNKTPRRRSQKIRGVDYVYEDLPYWDKEVKQTRHKREYIGKLGPNGEFIPNKKYLARQQQEQTAEKGAAATTVVPVNRLYYGATYLLDSIGCITGVESDLKICFPDSYKQILSLAYYLVLESDSPMYRFPRWSHDHRHPYGDVIKSQRISELLGTISEASKMEFFRRQSVRRLEKEYLAYDTTSVSSYSEYIKIARFGKNKDGDSLPQVNLALVFGEESRLPVYYRKLPGNITDVTTINKLLKDVKFLDIKKLKLVMDRGFYSAANLNALFRHHYKFLIATKCSSELVSGLLDRNRESIKDFRNYDYDQDVYCVSSTESWPYVEMDKTGKIIQEGKRRIYVHIYYNGQRAEEEKAKFIKKLAQAKQALLDNECTDEQKSPCEKYFIVKSTPKRGISIKYKDDVIAKKLSNAGYFILLSNEIKDPIEALSGYRGKDVIEKAFDNLKERLEMRRTSVESNENLEGRFFIQFVGLIYISYLHKLMNEHHLYRNYTMQSLFDELDLIERFDYPGQRHHCSEVTKKQKDLYDVLGIKPPNML